ncbi:MAG: DsbC family protein [Proteobacteria bacterium]|nr:DsbC family protein [Pseudomonadota bacterium]
MYKTLTLFLITSFVVNAQEPSKEILAGVKNLAPTAKVSSVVETPIKGVSEIVIETGRGGEVYYISNDGKYLMNGNMIDTATREDLTENKKSAIRKKLMSKFGKQERIDFLPKEDMQHHVYVFTDIDCGYCRKMHKQMDEYNKLGIGISYLFYPRSGIGTPSYDKSVTVWCADNQQEAMTNAKAGIKLENKTCDNPIANHYKTGQTIGVAGTPAIVLENGKLLPGYLPPEALLQRLNVLNAK